MQLLSCRLVCFAGSAETTISTPLCLPARPRGWGELLFVEVKGRVVGAATVTITRNEILTGLNKGQRYILALVRVSPDDLAEVRYLYDPFMGQDDALTGVASVNYEFEHFWQRGEAPR